MTPKRTIVVAVAVGVGLLAAVLSYVFLNGAQQRAYHGAKLVPAYVVTKAVPRAMTGSEAVSGGYLHPAERSGEVPTLFGHHLAVGAQRQRSRGPVCGWSGSRHVDVREPRHHGGVELLAAHPGRGRGREHLGRPGPQRLWSGCCRRQGGPVRHGQQPREQPASERAHRGRGPSTSSLGPTAQNTSVQTDSVTPTTQPNSGGLYTFDVTPAQAASIAYAQQESLGLYMASGSGR